MLAATILFIATNAGVIGASRITYAMAGYRQLPEAFRRLHPKLKTPWLSLVVFAGFVSILTLLPGRSTSSGRCTPSGRCSRSRSRTSRSSCSGIETATRSSHFAVDRTSASAVSPGRSSLYSARCGTGLVLDCPRRPNAGDAVGGLRLAGHRLRRLRRLSEVGRSRAAARDRTKAPASIRAGPGARVSAAPCSRDRRASRRMPRWTSPAVSPPSATPGSSR